MDAIYSAFDRAATDQLLKAPVRAKVQLAGTNRPSSVKRTHAGELLRGDVKVELVELACGGNDWELYAYVAEMSARKRTAFFGIREPASVDLLSLIIDLSVFGKLNYGFGYSWSKSTDPSLHAVGLTAGLPRTPGEWLNADHDALWFEERLSRPPAAPKMRHLKGCLRDVYELNVLNDTHLKTKMHGGETLEHFVRSRTAFGTIISGENGASVWTVPVDRIPAARAVLQRANILICTGSSELLHGVHD